MERRGGVMVTTVEVRGDEGEAARPEVLRRVHEEGWRARVPNGFKETLRLEHRNSSVYGISLDAKTPQ